MAGMASQDEDEDDMDLGEWSQVSNRGRSGRGRDRRHGESLVGSQTSKRSLEEISSDEGTNIVRKKIVREGFKIIVRFRKEDEEIKLSPIALSRELEKKFGEVQLAKILRDGNLLIGVKTEEQKKKVLNIESICKKKVREKRVLGENKVTRGVIFGIPVGEDLEKLKLSIRGGEVSRVKRLLKTIDGEKVESQSILLEFQEDVLPERIRVGCMSFTVRAYIPPPIRCYKCQRYGHISAICKGKQRCPKCGGEHRYEECRENVQDKCCNCGGQHRVSYGGCEVRKKAVEVEQIKVVHNISYAEALKRAQNGKDGTRKGQPKSTTDLVQKQETHIGLTVEKMILFMAYVINCTDQVKHKTEKIKIIVKGAERFFGFKDISWEQINKKLGEEGKGGGSGDRTI